MYHVSSGNRTSVVTEGSHGLGGPADLKFDAGLNLTANLNEHTRHSGRAGSLRISDDQLTLLVEPVRSHRCPAGTGQCRPGPALRPG